MIIGHIGARGGSKGLPNKNFRMMHGRPLIDWSLEMLLQHHKIDAVIVSTDDNVIYDHALTKGAVDIGLRPDHLSDDTASKWSVWQDSLQKAEQVCGQVSLFVDLDCTSPLRDADDITDAIDLFETEQPDMVMSCCHARKNPYFNMVELTSDGALEISKPLNQPIVSRQTAPIVYEHAASTYVLQPDYLKKASSLFEGRVIPYLMPIERCHDIDSLEDFELVEFLMGKKLKRA